MSELEIMKLWHQLEESIPESTKKDLASKATDGIIKLMVGSGTAVFKNLITLVNKKGVTTQEIEEKGAKDASYARYLSRVVATVSREQVAEKLDAWSEVLFNIHIGTLNNPIDIDLYTKLLEDCTLQDLIALGELYHAAEIDTETPVTAADIPHIASNQADITLQRLANFGLLTPKFDRSGFWSDGKNPILANFYYTRNQLGKDFLSHIGTIRTKQLTATSS